MLTHEGHRWIHNVSCICSLRTASGKPRSWVDGPPNWRQLSPVYRISATRTCRILGNDDCHLHQDNPSGVAHNARQKRMCQCSSRTEFATSGIKLENGIGFLSRSDSLVETRSLVDMRGADEDGSVRTFTKRVGPLEPRIGDDALDFAIR